MDTAELMTVREFFANMADAFNSPTNVASMIFLLLAILAVYLAIRLTVSISADRRKVNRLINKAPILSKRPKKPVLGFNAVQKRAAFDIIAEFKKKEIMSQAIPYSVLERFAEYLYEQEDRLKISEKLSAKVVGRIYPLAAGTRMEIEVWEADGRALSERYALFADGRSVAIDSIDSLNRMPRGQAVYISYSSGNHFITGDSRVTGTDEKGRMLLAYPVNLSVASQRHFTRVPLRDVEGSLSEIGTGSNLVLKVDVKDVSLEGMRISTNAPLKNSVIYKLGFADTGFSPTAIFPYLECVVARSFRPENSRWEYGFSFVCLDLDTRMKLVEYLRSRVRSIREKKPAA